MPASGNTSRQRRAPVKGSKIRFITGRYKGYNGWLDTAGGATNTMNYVIVDLNGKEIPTRVKKSSYIVERTPNTYVEAIFYQHPDILASMVRLARQLSECRLDGNDEDELEITFSSMLHRAVVANTGQGARYRDVDWTLSEEPNVVEDDSRL